MTLTGGVALALVMLTSAGNEGPQPPLKDDRPWPDGAVRKFHLLGGLTLGACVRLNSPVAGSGPCGEVVLAGDLPLTAQSRLGIELGLGLSRRIIGSDPEVVFSSGGPAYGALRVLYQCDVLPVFFVRLGPQLKTTVALRRAVFGVQHVLEVGTRIGSRIELGVRTSVGVDGVAASAGPRWRSSVAVGSTFVARVRLW